MELHEGIERALDGESLLFIGAGFSLGAINLRGNGFRSGPELASYFAALTGLPKETLLEDASEAFVEKFGKDGLISEIQHEYTVKKLQEHHLEIARIPWKRIYTTNYDNILEDAYGKQGKPLTPVTSGTDVYNVPKKHTICVHLNGYVNNLNRDTLWTELKLTETGYITSSIADSQWAVMLRQDIRLSKSVFFIGYSLYDLDIKRILSDSFTNTEKSFFFVGSNPDDATRRRCSRFGTVLSITADKFACELSQIRKNYSPVEIKDLSTFSVPEIKAPQYAKQITDRSFMELVQLGKRNHGLIYESLSSGVRYFLERKHIDQVFDLIDRGEKIIVVCSDLGNGKSLFLEGLQLRALERGFRVFDVRENTEEVFSELSAIAKLKDKIIVTIEEYQDWLDEIRLFLTNAMDQATLILTSRNSIHDVVIDDLIDVTGVNYIPEIQIDVLTDEEIEWYVQALNEYGLWGNMAAFSKRNKIKYLVENCDRQIHAILLRMFESPDIGARFRRIHERIRQQPENYNILLSIFILSVINYKVTLETLIDIWGSELINSPHFRRTRSAREYVDFTRSELVVRSPIAAEYNLRVIADAGSIVSVLIIMANRINTASKVSKQYRKLFKNLMRFSNLQFILPDEGRKAAVVRYYESIKNLSNCNRNPLFWLQYAIASLVIRDLFRSKKFFDTSYALAQKLNWDTFQIDNHYARFLLVQAVEVLDPREGLDNFRLARTIINRQIRNERRHYPYRVATSYQDFIDRFSSSLSSAQVDEVAEAARIILERISQLPQDRSKHRYVVKCKKAMEYVLTRSEEILSKLNEKKEDSA